MADVVYGCDCVCTNHATGAENAPVAYLVERKGKQMKVCTRCDLSSDKRVGRFYDETTPVNAFWQFDALGAMCMTLDRYMQLPVVTQSATLPDVDVDDVAVVE